MEERTDSGEKQGGGKQPCLRCIRKGEREREGKERGGPRTKGVKGGGERGLNLDVYSFSP